MSYLSGTQCKAICLCDEKKTLFYGPDHPDFQFWEVGFFFFSLLKSC